MAGELKLKQPYDNSYPLKIKFKRKTEYLFIELGERLKILAYDYFSDKKNHLIQRLFRILEQ